MAFKKSLFPIFAFFVLINTLAILLRQRLETSGFDIDVLLIGNLFLCILTAVSYALLHKGMQAATTAGFLRAVYGSFIAKFMLVAVVVLTYAFIQKDQLNKPALFTCMALYLFYTFLETWALIKLTKKGEDAKS